MKIYEKVTSLFGTESIKLTDEDGKIYYIPIDEANSDYQAYLNKDKPVEHFTPSV
jgi:hypothetical protein